MRNFATLFDRKYLAKGLALYGSLQKQSSEPFTLYVLPLDDFTRKYLNYEIDKGALNNMRIMRCYDLPKAATYYDTKPIPYRYFMLASEVTLALMKMIQKPVTYMDADIYWFSNPERVYAVIGNNEVGIIPHRFPAHDYERLRPNGLFNVSFVYFNNTQKAIDTLIWWNQQCHIKCDVESCGDQKYLDEFHRHTNKLAILPDIGMGAGPWNTYTYEVTEGPKLNNEDLIFYHCHETQQTKEGGYQLTKYPITPSQKKFIYDPYIEVLTYAQEHIDKKAGDWNA